MAVHTKSVRRRKLGEHPRCLRCGGWLLSAAAALCSYCRKP